MIFVIILLILTVIFIIYTIYDNHRIVIKKEKININKLKNELKILQLSDVHSKKLERKDYEKINALQYDVIVLTGDIMEDDDFEVESLKDFIKNIDNKEYIIYVDGNNGPKTYDRKSSKITKFGKMLESLGIIVMTDKVELNVHDEKIIFSNFNILTSKILENDKHGKYSIYNYFIDEMNSNKENVNIALGHFPLNIEGIKTLSKEKEKFYVPDVILAGHFHGGQFRVPFIGAIVIPRYNKPGFIFFPNQKLVSGLYEYEGIKQYISSGLGNSRHYKLLSFRILDTPSIDLLTIK